MYHGNAAWASWPPEELEELEEPSVLETYLSREGRARRRLSLERGRLDAEGRAVRMDSRRCSDNDRASIAVERHGKQCAAG